METTGFLLIRNKFNREVSLVNQIMINKSTSSTGSLNGLYHKDFDEQLNFRLDITLKLNKTQIND